MRERKRTRLLGFDYRTGGAYFVTICVLNHACVFGEIVGGVMIVNDMGRMVQRCWEDIPSHFPHVQLGEWVMMPNHIHGIVWIDDGCAPVGGENFRPLHTYDDHHRVWSGARSRSLSSIIRGFKIGVTKWCRANNHGHFVWQRSFHDRTCLPVGRSSVMMTNITSSNDISRIILRGGVRIVFLRDDSLVFSIAERFQTVPYVYRFISVANSLRMYRIHLQKL